MAKRVTIANLKFYCWPLAEAGGGEGWYEAYRCQELGTKKKLEEGCSLHAAACFCLHAVENMMKGYIALWSDPARILLSS